MFQIFRYCMHYMYIEIWYIIGNIIFHCESTRFESHSFYGFKANVYPKSSCLRINNIHRVGYCLQTCIDKVGIHYMLSYNKDQQACLCCVDFSGSDVTDPSWNTYEIVYCYKGYDNKARSCLKFIPQAVSFTTAESRCHKEGGALLKLDSRQKFDILTEYISPVGKIYEVQAWIQAKKIGGDWYFDDGTTIPSDACPTENSNVRGENRLRFRFRESDSVCADMIETTRYDTICEYDPKFN